MCVSLYKLGKRFLYVQVKTKERRVPADESLLGGLEVQ